VLAGPGTDSSHIVLPVVEGTLGGAPILTSHRPAIRPRMELTMRCRVVPMTVAIVLAAAVVTVLG
jgi:hypothetical protein